MNQDDIKSNLLDAGQWLRMLFMAGFAVAAWLVVLALIVLVLAQTLIVLLAGEANRNLRKAGYLLGCYLQEIIQYLCYNTNTKPFPFADFPAAAEVAPMASASPAAAPADTTVPPEPDQDEQEAPPSAPFHHSPGAGMDEPQDPSPR